MAWDTKCGILKSQLLSDDEYWSLFSFVFSESCHKTTSYKFALVKAILDNLFNNIPSQSGQEILYFDIFAKFAESFWNLVVKHGLRQQAANASGKTSKIEQIFQAAVQENNLLYSVEFDSIEKHMKLLLIKNVQKECKKYVLGALYEDLGGAVYRFNQNGDRITISHGAYQFMLKHKIRIEKLAYYSWAKFLEAANEEHVLYKVLNKIELSVPKRNSLEKYRAILFREFEENNCFYCGKKLAGIIHTDHFIPWSFIKEDKLWNFVLSCPECNTKKSNILPPESFIPLIQERNRRILSRSSAKKSGASFVREQFQNYSDTLIPNLWNYAKQSGFRAGKFVANSAASTGTMYSLNPLFGALTAASPE